MLTGYFDETKKQKGPPFTGVGGFLFRKEQIITVQNKVALLGEPKSASDTDLETLKQIAKITADHRGEGFVVTLADNDYEEWKRAMPQNAKWLGPPYAICMIHLIDMLRQHLEGIGSDEEVCYIVESGADGMKEAKRHFNQIMENDAARNHLRMRNFNFIPKCHKPDSYVLRSADLLINQWQRNHWQLEQTESSGMKDSGWTEPMRLLFRDAESAPIRHYHISDIGLKNTALLAALMCLRPRLR
jgi:hypothetical protein